MKTTLTGSALLDKINAAYVELFNEVENGTIGKNFFDLRETFRNLQGKVLSDHPKGNRLMQDWKIPEQCLGDMEEGDQSDYFLSYNIANQSFLDVFDSKNKSVLGVTLEINNGVPTVHLSTGGDNMLLHIHCVDNKLILTPEDRKSCFGTAESNSYSYNYTNALVLSHE
jgi:hypothetical protein